VIVSLSRGGAKVWAERRKFARRGFRIHARRGKKGKGAAPAEDGERKRCCIMLLASAYQKFTGTRTLSGDVEQRGVGCWLGGLDRWGGQGSRRSHSHRPIQLGGRGAVRHGKHPRPSGETVWSKKGV